VNRQTNLDKDIEGVVVGVALLNNIFTIYKSVRGNGIRQKKKRASRRRSAANTKEGGFGQFVGNTRAFVLVHTLWRTKNEEKANCEIYMSIEEGEEDEGRMAKKSEAVLKMWT
jgi:hypothetical protein